MATQSVGKFLRDERLRRGLALDEISACTKIPVGLLQAIEADDMSHISSAFLYRSFARQFADVLQLDYEQLRSAVNASAEAYPQPKMPGQEDHGPRVPALGSSYEHRVRWGVSVIALAVVLVGCSGLYALWQKAHIGANEAAVARTQSSESEMNSANASGPNSVPQNPAAEPVPRAASRTSDASAQPAPDSELEVRISAVEKAWVSMDTDGKRIYSGLLEAADTKVLEGHQTARIHTGNAGGINVVFNGKRLGPLGGRGQVMTVVFTRNNYEVVEPHLSAAIDFRKVSNVTAR
jgi:cytoskeleton protein RodZ